MRKLLLLLLFVVLYSANLQLTNDEKNYIKTHTFVCVTTTSWAPFNTYKKSEVVGISVDFWKLIKNKLNIKSVCKTASSWSYVLDQIKSQKADITLGTDITPEKSKYALFTKPYDTFPISIATKNNIGFIASMDFLKNKTIAVGKNYTVYSMLKKRYPNYRFVETKDIKTALKLVSEGRAFAAIDIMPVLIYNINRYQFANLKIAGKTPLEYKIRFMVAKKDKMLVDVLNKAIDTITPSQKEQIYRKWIHVTYQKGYTLSDLLPTIIACTVLVLALILWIVMLKREIKKRKELEIELKRLSIIDSLTGIFNRYKLDTSLKQQISFARRHKTPLSLIFCDIDNFKRINDKYGHTKGDEVLKKITSIIKRNIREYDIFGRWGGEEFIIILPNTSLQDAIHVAEKLKFKIENHNFGIDEKLTCSFGVTQLKKIDTSDSFLGRADQLMYEAKKRGKNTIVSDINA